MNHLKSEEERISNLKKLHIGKLKSHEPLDENALKDYFTQFGEVVNLNIPKETKPDSDSTTLKGYGFVEFASLDAAKKCVRTKSHTFAEKELQVHRSIPRELLTSLNDARREADNNECHKVFLRNKENFTTDQLLNFLSSHPKLPITPKKVECPKDKEDKPKGFAVLEFEHEDDCICLVTVVKLKIEKEGGGTKELYPSFFVKNNNHRFRGQYGGGFGYGRGGGGWNQGYGYDDFYYGNDYDDYYQCAPGDYYGYHGGNYGGYGNQGYGSYGGGGGFGGRRFGGGGGRPYSGGGGGRGARRGGDYA